MILSGFMRRWFVRDAWRYTDVFGLIDWLNANLSAAAGSPVDLVFEVNGAVGGAIFYADDDKKKVRSAA